MKKALTVILAGAFLSVNTLNGANEKRLFSTSNAKLALPSKLDDSFELSVLLDALTNANNSKETSEKIAAAITRVLRSDHGLLPSVIIALSQSDIGTTKYLTGALERVMSDKTGPKLTEADVERILDVLEKTDYDYAISEHIASIMTFVLARDPNLRLSDPQLRVVLNQRNRAHWKGIVVEHALLNNPGLIKTAMSHIVKAWNALWLVDVIARHISGSEIKITPDIIMLLTNIAGDESSVFNKIIEPLFFRQPNLFTAETLRALEETYAADVPEFKYLLFYASMAGIVSPVSLGSLFPHQRRFKELMSNGKKRVLIVHNIADGLGDELIRNSTLMQALLDFNPELEITLYTDRSFLYDHPRIKVKKIESEFDLSNKDRFDMIIHHYDVEQKYSSSFEWEFGAYLNSHHSPIYVVSDKGNDHFVPKTVRVDNETIQLSGFEEDSLFNPRSENVYTPTFRLCAELGLCFRHGTQKSRESLFTSLPNPAAQAYWKNVVTTANSDKRPIAVFNGFGGEDMEKGFVNGKSSTIYNQGGDEDDFRKILQKLIAEGFFVIVLPNGKVYGRPEVADHIISTLSSDERRQILIAPDPSRDAKLHKYLIGHSGIAMVVTVEGGLMHLSYNMGIPFSILLMKKSGYILQWLPIGMDHMQGYCGLQYNDRVTRRDVIEGFTIPTAIRMAAFGSESERNSILPIIQNEQDDPTMTWPLRLRRWIKAGQPSKTEAAL